MADIPVYGPSEVDQNPNSVSLSAPGANPNALPNHGITDVWWRDLFMKNADAQRPGIAYQTGNQDQARLEQQRVIQDLQRAAGGDPNSLAQQQLRQGYGQAQAQQSSLGSTMRGQSAGAAMRGVQAGQQGIQRGLAGDQQMLQLQEQQAAQAMLAQMLSQQQGQDINQAQGMANASLGNQSLDDLMRQFYLGGASQMDMAATERQNAVARAQLGLQEQQRALAMRGINQTMQAGAGAVGVGMSFGGGKPQQSGFNTDGVTGINPSNPNEWQNPWS